METAVLVAQVVIALGIFNVWFLRFGKATAYRGGGAKNMKEEFRIYGLPSWFVYVVGGMKVLVAVLLLVGLAVPEVVRPAGIAMAVLMLGAVAMHVKVRDPVRKALPATIMLLLAAFVALA